MDCGEIRNWLERNGREKPPPETREAIIGHVARCPLCSGDPRIVALMPKEFPPGEPPADEPSGFDLAERVQRVAATVILACAMLVLGMSLLDAARLGRRLAIPQPVPEELRERMRGYSATGRRETDDPEDDEDKERALPDEARIQQMARQALDVDVEDLAGLDALSARFRRADNQKAIRRLAESDALEADQSLAVEACLLRLGGAGWDAQEWRATLELINRLDVMQAIEAAVSGATSEATDDE